MTVDWGNPQAMVSKYFSVAEVTQNDDRRALDMDRSPVGDSPMWTSGTAGGNEDLDPSGGPTRAIATFDRLGLLLEDHDLGDPTDEAIPAILGLGLATGNLAPGEVLRSVVVHPQGGAPFIVKRDLQGWSAYWLPGDTTKAEGS